MLTIPGLKSKLPFRFILIFIVLLNLTTRLLLVDRPLQCLDGVTIPDDAYLSLQIARNIAEGKGPLYYDTYTNGFQPLYVFLMVPVYALSADQVENPVKIALLILSLFDTATLIVLLLWIKRLTNTIVMVISSLVWIFNDYIIQTSLNGLETIMAAFFIVWASYYYYLMYFVFQKREIKHFIMLGMIVGFACLTRVDSCIFAAILGIFILVKELNNKYQLFLRASAYGICALFLFSFWAIYSIHYTGGWFPESGKAVRLISLAEAPSPLNIKWFIEMFRKAASVERNENGFLILLLGVLILYSIRKRTLSVSMFKSIQPLFLFCVAIFLAYTCYIFTFWYFYRYFFPFTIFFLLTFAILLHPILLTASDNRKMIYLSVIMLLWFTPLIARGNFYKYYFGGIDKERGYRNLGLWANENLPAGTIVGCSQSGGLGYFATKLNVINLDGVVNRKCYESLVENRNIEYIKDSKIEYILGWDINMKYIEIHSKTLKKTDLIFIKKIDSFQSWSRYWYLYKVGV